MHPTDIVARIERERVVAVLRLADPDRLRAVIDALAAGGVRIFEVTMTVPRAIELIGQLAVGLDETLLVGAGTVIDADTARRVIGAVLPVGGIEVPASRSELWRLARSGRVKVNAVRPLGNSRQRDRHVHLHPVGQQLRGACRQSAREP